MRYDQKEVGPGSYSFIARNDSKPHVLPLEVFPLEVYALLESSLPHLEASLKLLDASQGSFHVLFDVLHPFKMLFLEDFLYLSE